MNEISLSDLIEQVKEAIRVFQFQPETIRNYKKVWNKLTGYFLENHQVMFSKQLAERYILEAKQKLDAGSIEKWQYGSIRQKTNMLIEYYEHGQVTWKLYADNGALHLQQSAFILMQKEYLNHLNL